MYSVLSESLMSFIIYTYFFIFCIHLDIEVDLYISVGFLDVNILASIVKVSKIMYLYLLLIRFYHMNTIVWTDSLYILFSYRLFIFKFATLKALLRFVTLLRLFRRHYYISSIVKKPCIFRLSTVLKLWK